MKTNHKRKQKQKKNFIFLQKTNQTNKHANDNNNTWYTATILYNILSLFKSNAFPSAVLVIEPINNQTNL